MEEQRWAARGGWARGCSVTWSLPPAWALPCPWLQLLTQRGSVPAHAAASKHAVKAPSLSSPLPNSMTDKDSVTHASLSRITGDELKTSNA